MNAPLTYASGERSFSCGIMYRVFFIVSDFSGAVPKVMSVALIEPLVEMTATLNVVVSINSTTVMQTY